jgi:predicted transcriptional regulator
MKRKDREVNILKFLSAHRDKAYTSAEVAQDLRDDKHAVKNTIAKLHKLGRINSLISEHGPTYYYVVEGEQNGQTIKQTEEESQ